MRVLLIDILLMISLLANVLANEYHFNSIGLEQGLSQDMTLDVYQDEFSRIWTATSDGINCFDGNKVYPYRINNIKNKTIKNFNVRRITGDKKGHLFLRTSSQLLKFDLRTEEVSVVWNNATRTMANGRNGLWFIADHKLFQYDVNTGKIISKFTSLKVDLSSKEIMESSTGSLWIAHSDKGLMVIASDGFFKKIPIYSEVLKLYEGPNRNIWIGTKDAGIFCYSPHQSGIISHIEPKFNEIRALCFDSEQNLWFGSRNGLGKYDFTSKNFSYFSTDDNSLNPISYNSVNSLIMDKYETLWIGTYLGGVNYLNPKQQNFRFISAKNTALPRYAINNLIEDTFGNVWIGTDGGGICQINPDDGRFTIYSTETKQPIGTDNVKEFFFDKNRNILWIVGNFSNKLTSISSQTGEVKIYPIVYPSEENNTVSALFGLVSDGDDLYIAQDTEVLIYNIKTGKTRKSDTLSGLYNRLNNDLVMDRMKNLWFSYSDKVISYSVVDESIRQYSIDTDGKLLGIGNLFYNDSEGNVWLGTHDLGLFLLDVNSGVFKPFVTYQPLVNSNILSIGETYSGDMLFATADGMVLWNKVNNSFVYLAYNKDFVTSTIKRRCMAITKSGSIYLGANNGLFIYDERNFSTVKQSAKLYFSRLFLNNNEVKVSDHGDKSLLNEKLPYIKEIVLPHSFILLSIEYYVDNLISKSDPVEYRLKGNTDEWIESKNGNVITFSNISPGTYTLQARLINNPEVISELKIKVRSPLYATWWAMLFYIVSAALITWWLVRQYRERFFLKTSLDFEKREKQQIEYMNQSKTRFFTNISHEIKTPITLIMAQIDLLLESHKLENEIIKKLRNIYRSASNLKSLVNELLDFSKQEKGELKIMATEVNIVPLLSEFFIMFNDLATTKSIDFRFQSSSQNILLWVDSEQMHKVINNLLSNAFKYTPTGGQIVLKIEDKVQSAVISVEDTGSGVLEKEYEKIFERFYQVKDSGVVGGSGIGLALSKAIVEMHGGKISVSNAFPKGAIFTVEIPKGNAHLRPENILSTIVVNQESLIEIKAEETREMNDQEIMKILVVDDNQDIRDVLYELLSKDFHVSLAADGVEAYNKVATEIPDLVIADVMMPNMSGTELCEKIKENMETCHIPVVLLTAKSGVENEVEGLRVGADSYVTKPFSSVYLLTQINNLFKSRRLLRDKYLREVNAPVENVAINSLDQDFLRKATRVIEANLDNEEFNIDVFSREMGLGRTSLFSKMKGITGQTPNNFILNMRLKKAAQLLLTDRGLNVSDVSYMLGFSSPRYFNKCFKDLFGMAPANYRKVKHLD